jgi:hypothetical protein
MPLHPAVPRNSYRFQRELFASAFQPAAWWSTGDHGALNLGCGFPSVFRLISGTPRIRELCEINPG